MKKITYKTLKVQNFLSVGNNTITIDLTSGIHQIEGINKDEPERRNAVGKSVVANSHFFALFGETVNKIKSEFVVNNITKGKGLIELEFDVETREGVNSYIIKRQIKPSKVELWKNGVDITLDSIANTNKYICDLLNTNPTIYKCCDIMTIRETVPFMSMEAAEKRKFIEDIFAIDVFGRMLKDLKKMVSDNKSDTGISIAKLGEQEKSLKSLKDQKELVRKEIENRELVLEKRKEEIIKSRDGVIEQLAGLSAISTDDIDNNIQKLKAARVVVIGRIKDCNDACNTITLNIRGVKNDIDKYTNIEGGIRCPKCLQEITAEHIGHLGTLVVENQAKLEDFQTNLDDGLAETKTWSDKQVAIDDKISELGNDLERARANNQRITSLTESLAQYNKSFKELELDISNVSNSLESFDTTISEWEDLIVQETENLRLLRQTTKDLDICKFILGEEGVKSLVVKKLLDLLNNTIDKYLNLLGMNVRCKFDEYFEEVVTNTKGKLFSYKNASGAEKKSLDFACAFSFADMRRKIHQVYSNTQFFDEVLDTALDEKGLDLIMTQLKEKVDVNGACVYIISHKKEMKKHITGETIMLAKENGVTSRISSGGD